MWGSWGSVGEWQNSHSSARLRGRCLSPHRYSLAKYHRCVVHSRIRCVRALVRLSEGAAGAADRAEKNSRHVDTFCARGDCLRYERMG